MRKGFGSAPRVGAWTVYLAGISVALCGAAVAGDVCSSLAPCAAEPASTTAGALTGPAPAEVMAAVVGLEGGARTPALGLHPPFKLGEVAWTPLMDRHELIIGAIDPDHDDAYQYRLPYGEHVSYPVIQGYGARLSHRGAEQYTVDFGMPIGTPVYAARDGVVALAEDSHDVGCWREECGRLANFVVLLHSDGTTGEYFHLLHGSVQVRVGERVARGALLAFSGNTGYTTAPHLHFGVYRTERDGQTQSLAVRFTTREGLIREPREGARYLNLPARD